jgi:PAS domain S-box-containing protein
MNSLSLNNWLIQVVSGSGITGIVLVLASIGVYLTVLSHLLPKVYYQKKEIYLITQRLKSLCNVTSDGIITTDYLGGVTSLNTRAENLTGFRSVDIIGKDVSEIFKIINSQTMELETCPVNQAINENRTVQLGDAALMLSAFGKRIPIAGCCVPILHQNSERGGAIVVFQQKTERENQSRLDSETKIEAPIQETRILADEAKAAREARSLFLASIGHAIRTPLNAVIGMSHLIWDTDLDEAQRRYIGVVKESSESLLRLINDMIDYSTIESGKLDLEIQDFNLQEFIDDFISCLVVKSEKKGLELICSVNPGVPVLIRGDPGRIRQILNNLTDNALKFTGTGEVEIKVSLVAETFYECKLQFNVRDTGVGVPEEMKHQICQLFGQPEFSERSQLGGSGLGLAISKQLVDLMRGNIGFESTLGKGSVFWFTVSLEKQSGDTKHHDHLNILDLRKIKILIVDDNQTNLEILAIRLKSWGIRAFECQDPELAIRMLLEAHDSGDPFTIGIIDAQMPEMPGETLGRAIKNDQKCRKTRLILLTPFRSETNAIDQNVRRIFDVYLHKPVRHQELYVAICTIVQRTMLGELSPPSHSDRPAAVTTFSSPKRVLLVEDNTTNQEVVLRMLERLGLTGDAVANGLEALDVLKSIPYDLVLMDIQMPVMDGIEATQRIRCLETPVLNHKIPIIAMTAHAMQGDREKYFQRGMNDYLAKPFTLSEFSKILHRWLSMQLPEQNETLTERLNFRSVSVKGDEKMSKPVFDLEAFSERMMDDKEIMVSVMESYLTDIPDLVKLLEEALSDGDMTETERLAHSIKGASNNMGGEDLGHLAYEIEKAAHLNETENMDDLIHELKTRFSVLESELIKVIDAYKTMNV